MADCWALRGVIGGSQHVDGVTLPDDDAETFLYVPTSTGIDRWTFSNFTQEVDWFTKSGGVESLAVDNGGQIFYKANTGGHLWRIQSDASGDTDRGAITAGQLVYSPHEDCLYGTTFGANLYRVTLAGTETTPFTGGTTVFRPTVQRGGIVWFSDGFTLLRRIDPDNSFAETNFSASAQYPMPACPGKAGVYFDTHFYTEGITQAPITCQSWISDLHPCWTSDYTLILGDDGGSGATHVYSLRCGAKPPLRISQRSDDLMTGSPRINPSFSRASTAQKSVRIPGSNSHF